MTPLEDRTVPATITWTAPTGGNFAIGSNWSSGTVPGPSDDAVINLASAGAVTYNAAGELKVGSISTNSNTTLNISQGTVTIAASPSLGTFSGPVNVAFGATMAANSGAKVLINPGVTVDVLGTLSVDSTTIAAYRTFGNSAVTVESGGTLTTNKATFTASGSTDYAAQILVKSNGTFQCTNSTFSWDNVTLDNASKLADTGVATSTFNAALTTPVKYLRVFADPLNQNQKFGAVYLTGATDKTILNAAPLGIDTSNQQYYFPSGTFTVTAGTALNFTANSKVQLNPGANVDVLGTLSVDSTTIAAYRTFGNSAVTVESGGTLTTNKATFTASGSTDYAAQILVKSNGTFQSTNSTFSWDNVTLDPTSSVGVVTGSTFVSTLTTPAKHIPTFVGNASFRDVVLTTGTNDQMLTLSPLGVDASLQQYVFPSGTFTVFAGTSLSFTSNAKVLLNPGANVDVSGTLSVDSTTIAAYRTFGNSAVTVESGGTLTTNKATFTASGSTDYAAQILVKSNGTFQSTNSTFSWDNVTLDNASKLADTGVVSSAFDSALTVPVKYLRVLADPLNQNQRFGAVYLTGATDKASLTVAPLGIDASNQQYYFPSGTFTVTAGTALNITANTKVQLNPGANLDVLGTLSVTSPATFAAYRTFGDSAVTVENAGVLKATNANFTASGSTSYVSQILVKTGGLFSGTGNVFGWDVMTLAAGSTALLQYNYFNTKLNVSSATNLSPNTIRNNDFSAVKVVASGNATAMIDLTNNFWGSTVASVIGSHITDHVYPTQNLALPTVNFGVVGPPATLLSVRPVQTLVIAPPATPYSLTDQTVSLSAQFRSPSGTGLVNVNGGTVTFTVLNGSVPVGMPQTAPVSAGTATVPNYTIPGLTNAGTYTIQAVFSGITGSYAPSTDNSQTLTVNPSPTTTTAVGATRVFSVAAGSINLTANVAAALGAVSQGAVVFQLYDASNTTPVLPAQSLPGVTAGIATVPYALPASFQSGTYTIRASYSGTTNLGASSDSSQTLVITPAITTVASANSTASYSGLSQNVTLSATVASPAGLVNNGTVTFTVKTSGGTVIGIASGSVVNGVATSSPAFVLPANTSAGNYTIQADYSSTINYSSSTDSTKTLIVNQASQTITFPTVPPAVFTPGGTITLAATGGASGNTVVYTIVGGTGTGTIAGNILTITGAGTIVIASNQAGNTNYSLAATVQQTITINQAPQTITFINPGPTTFTPGGTISLTATGGASGNTVVFTIVGGTGSGTIAGNVLTITGAGTIVIASNQAGNTNYTSAATVQQTITINQASQTITFVGPGATTFSPGGTITLSATGGASGNAVTFTVISGPGSVSGNVLTITGAGSIVVSASQTGNGNYAPAVSVQQTVIINQATQVITFSGPSPITFAQGATVNLSATGGASGNAVVFTVISGPGTISGNVLTVTGAGSIIVAANQTGTANYSPATSIQQTVIVNQASTVVISVSTSTGFQTGSQLVSLTANVTSSAGVVSAGSVEFYVLQGSTSVATVTQTVDASGVAVGTATLPAGLAVGTYTIQTTYLGSMNFSASAADSSGFLTVAVNQQPPTITAIANQSIAAGSGTGAIIFTVGDAESQAGSLTVSATSSNGSVIPAGNIALGGTAASRTVTVTAPSGVTGSSDITVTVSDGSKTSSTTFKVTVNVVNAAPTISDIPNQRVVAGGSVGPISFTINDAETAAGSLIVTATANGGVIPQSNITLGGSGANRTISLAAGSVGTSTITVTVSDGAKSASDTFDVTVTPTSTGNTAPTIAAIANRTILKNGSTTFTVVIGDAETAAASLTLTATSTNAGLVPTGNVVITGSGSTRTVTVTPLANQIGTGSITLTVADGGGLAASSTFGVTVNDLVAVKTPREFSVGSDAGRTATVRFFNPDQTERYNCPFPRSRRISGRILPNCRPKERERRHPDFGNIPVPILPSGPEERPRRFLLRNYLGPRPSPARQRSPTPAAWASNAGSIARLKSGSPSSSGSS